MADVWSRPILIRALPPSWSSLATVLSTPPVKSIDDIKKAIVSYPSTLGTRTNATAMYTNERQGGKGGKGGKGRHGKRPVKPGVGRVGRPIFLAIYPLRRFHLCYASSGDFTAIFKTNGAYLPYYDTNANHAINHRVTLHDAHRVT